MTTTYSLLPFDKTYASSGELCVMVKKNYTSGTISNKTIKTDSNGNITYTANSNFNGAGICRLTSPTVFAITIDSTTYTFNDKGAALSLNAQGWKLVRGSVSGTASTTGSLVTSNTSVAITRGSSDGSKWTATTKSGTFATIVDSLNVRDQFAIEALKGILGHIEEPSSLSDSEINYYCAAAYQWAANMMTLAANTRSTVSDGMVSSDIETAEVSSLDSNTEKLLNNIAAAIEKTNAKEEATATGSDSASDDTTSSDSGDGTATEEEKSYIYKKRVKVNFDELVAWLQAYTAHTPSGSEDTKTTVGLDDLITAVSGKRDYSDIVNAIGNIKVTSDNTDLIKALKGTADTNNVYGAISGLGSTISAAMRGSTSNTLTACIKEVTAELKNVVTELKNIVTAINAGNAS